MLRIISEAELEIFVWGVDLSYYILVPTNPSRRAHTCMYEKKYLF
jgi:hypothetical protein